MDYVIGGFYRSFDNTFLYEYGSKEMSWGGHGALVYPFSIFTRIQADIFAQHISREAAIPQYYVDTTDQGRDTLKARFTTETASNVPRPVWRTLNDIEEETISPKAYSYLFHLRGNNTISCHL